MSDEKSPENEPTTEEILASIRRIISEGAEHTDTRAREGGTSPAAAGEGSDPDPVWTPDDEVLDLSQRIGSAATGDSRSPPDAAAQGGPPKGEPEDVLDLTEVVARKGEEALVSPATEAATAAAIAALAAALKDESRSVGDIRLGEGRTVEDLVGEIVRPLVREWLDRNLPSLVERLVEKEIQRLAGRAEGH